jgi:hypothetical protein
MLRGHFLYIPLMYAELQLCSNDEYGVKNLWLITLYEALLIQEKTWQMYE